MINIPTFQQLYASILSDLESEFNITIPLFGKNFLRALAAVQAAKLKIYYLAVGGVQKNIFVDTAEPESSGGTLERFGRVKLGRNPFPATAGQYTVQLTGQTGQTVSMNSTFKSDDTSTSPGKLYILDAAFIMDGVNIITLRALESGVDSRLSINDTLTSTAPIALVNSSAMVVTESIEPQAAETIDEYRSKAIEAYRLEPQGGAASDYRIWSGEVQGVAQSYIFATTGQTNQVDLFIEATEIDSIDGKGTPSGALLSDVTDIIEQPTLTRPSRKPVTVVVNYLPVNVKDVNVNIASFSGITAEITTLIENALISEISKIRPFVGAIDVLSDKNDILDTNLIISTILNARPGSVFGAVTMTVDAVAFSSYTFTNGEIPSLNILTIT
jgi:uncharacterized phage protein gp47/JayE